MSDDQPADWRTDTAKRPRTAGAHRASVESEPARPPAVRPRVAKVPPHAGEAPPPARFPLYADEYDGLESTSVHSLPLPQLPVEGLADEQPPRAEEPDWFSQAAEMSQVEVWEDERRSPVVWLLATVVVLAIAAAAWWYLARG